LTKYSQECQGENQQRSRRAAVQPGQLALRRAAPMTGIMLNTTKALNYLQLERTRQGPRGAHPRLPAPAGAVADNQRRIRKSPEKETPRARQGDNVQGGGGVRQFQSPNAGRYTLISTISKAYGQLRQPVSPFISTACISWPECHGRLGFGAPPANHSSALWDLILATTTSNRIWPRGQF